MSPENKQRLEKYREKYEILVRDQSLTLSIEERADIISIIRTVDPGYSVMEWCAYCVGEMVKYAFKLAN